MAGSDAAVGLVDHDPEPIEGDPSRKTFSRVPRTPSIEILKSDARSCETVRTGTGAQRQGISRSDIRHATMWKSLLMSIEIVQPSHKYVMSPGFSSMAS